MEPKQPGTNEEDDNRTISDLENEQSMRDDAIFEALNDIYNQLDNVPLSNLDALDTTYLKTPADDPINVFTHSELEYYSHVRDEVQAISPPQRTTKAII